jgi:hydroxyacylglutathione hydrolase
MKIEKITVGELLSNCYILISESNKESIIIDPGSEADKILGQIKKTGLKVRYIIATHGHIDHIGAIPDILRALPSPAPICVHFKDSSMLSDPKKNLSEFAGIQAEPVQPDIILNDGDVIETGSISLTVIHTPGHTPGGISLLGGDFLFTGDTLFAGGIGRTDLPGGDFKTLQDAIRNKIFGFEDKTVIYPGHGPESTIGAEKKSLGEWI